MKTTKTGYITMIVTFYHSDFLTNINGILLSLTPTLIPFLDTSLAKWDDKRHGKATLVGRSLLVDEILNVKCTSFSEKVSTCYIFLSD